MAESPATQVTEILKDIASKRMPSREGLALIYPAVYEQLRRLASAQMRGQAAGHTLTATALVHEAYLRLVNQAELRSTGRAQFFCVAAKAMRSVLVDHARRQAAQKRGGSWRRITFVDQVPPARSMDFEILDLHRAIEDLERRDERMAAVVELRVFGGLTVQESAAALGVAARTVDGDWRVARAWLADRMSREDPP